MLHLAVIFPPLLPPPLLALSAHSFLLLDLASAPSVVFPVAFLPPFCVFNFEIYHAPPPQAGTTVLCNRTPPLFPLCDLLFDPGFFSKKSFSDFETRIHIRAILIISSLGVFSLSPSLVPDALNALNFFLLFSLYLPPSACAPVKMAGPSQNLLSVFSIET